MPKTALSLVGPVSQYCRNRGPVALRYVSQNQSKGGLRNGE